MEEQILKFLKEAYSIGCYKVDTVTNEIYRCLAKEGTLFVRITNYKTYHEQLEEVSWTNFYAIKALALLKQSTLLIINILKRSCWMKKS